MDRHTHVPGVAGVGDANMSTQRPSWRVAPGEAARQASAGFGGTVSLIPSNRLGGLKTTLRETIGCVTRFGGEGSGARRRAPSPPFLSLLIARHVTAVY